MIGGCVVSLWCLQSEKQTCKFSRHAIHTNARLLLGYPIAALCTNLVDCISEVNVMEITNKDTNGEEKES